jgi:hypothetical protein
VASPSLSGKQLSAFLQVLRANGVTRFVDGEFAIVLMETAPPEPEVIVFAPVTNHIAVVYPPAPPDGPSWAQEDGARSGLPGRADCRRRRDRRGADLLALLA